MKSHKAKVLHEVFYRPMIHHVLLAVKPLWPKKTLVIVGHQEKAVKKSIDTFEIRTVRQEQQLGTGHAVLMTKDNIDKDDSLVMVLCGDTPLIRTESLEQMIEHHSRNDSALTVMTTSLNDPAGYGRIVSAGETIEAIVEHKDASDQQRKIQEINAGIYLVQRSLLFEALENITPDNTQGEFYLTDIVEYTVKKGMSAHKHHISSPMEVLGVNSRVELEEAHKQLQLQRNVALMQEGITLQNKESISVSPCTTVGQDTLLQAHVTLEGESIIGKKCIIEHGAVVRNCTLGDNVRIGAYSVLENRTIASSSSLKPFST